MKNHILTSAGFMTAVLVIVFVANSMAFAQCKAKESCYVADDTGPNPICSTSTYNACDNWLLWDIYVDRTEMEEYQPNLVCAIQNSGWSQTIHSHLFDPGQSHHVDGTHYCSSKSNHKITITRYGPTGYFEEITVAAVYVADDPTK
jgi:hypothetical protein